MISKLRLNAFRCFRSVSVELRPLTVLIGPNDSGKSAFLAALQYVAQGRGINSIDDVWNRLGQDEVRISASGSFGKVISAWASAPSLTPEARAAMQPVELFRLPSQGLQLQCPGYSDVGDPPALDQDGGNLPALLDHLLRRHRPRFDEYVDAIRERVSGLEDIEIGTPGTGHRSVELKLAGGLRLPPAHLSVGVRHMLFYLALAFHPLPPTLILLEEPENGIHPKRLADLVGLLRGLTRGLHGSRPVQVVLATHSPYLVDQIDLAEDQVLVFQRQDDGSRMVNPVDAEKLKVFLHESMLGEIWSLEGEEGLIHKQ